MNDNVVKQARMRYLCLALHYRVNLWLSLGAFEPGGEPFLDAVPAKGCRRDAVAVGCLALKSGCTDR